VTADVITPRPGYEDANGRFITQDSFQADFPEPYEKLPQPGNPSYTFIIIYPPGTKPNYPPFLAPNPQAVISQHRRRRK
jgi:hypothetical protein